MDILAATYTYRTTTYTSPYATSSVDATQLGAFFAGFAIFFITMIIIGRLVNMALTWGVYKKGGYKGWEGIVPFYNNYCLYKMAGVSVGLFVVSIFIPVVNIYMYFELAKKFGKDPIYGLGLFFLGIIFMPILGYGSAEYQGEVAENTASTTDETATTAATTEAKPAAKTSTKKSSTKKSDAEETK